MPGCWTCKTRRKKCDGQRPTCRECERLQLCCRGYQQRLVWEDDDIRAGMRRRGWRRPCRALSEDYRLAAVDRIGHANTGHTDDNTHIVLSLSLSPVAADGTLSPAESLLLSWYVNKFAVSYPSFNHSRNPFLSTMLPIAFRTPSLMRAMLAVAGTQACRQQPDLRPVTLQCRIGAIRGLRTTLDTTEDTVGALACALMLFIYEKIECEEDALGSHLSFAARLVAKLLPSCQRDVDGDVQFLVRLFVHNDIYTSIALRTRPALDSVPAFATLASTVLPGNTFHGMMAAISRLAAQSQMQSQSQSQSIDEVLDLVDSLNAWQPSMEWLPTASAREQTATMVVAAEMHRCAAVTAFRRCLGLDQDVGAVHSSMDVLLTIPADDPITASLLWPAVVLGAETEDEGRRRRLTDRLHALAEDTGFKQYSKALQLLRDCWAMPAGEDQRSWIDVMHSTGNVILCTL